MMYRGIVIFLVRCIDMPAPCIVPSLIIGVLNLKEIEAREGYDLNIFVILCKEEKCGNFQ